MLAKTLLIAVASGAAATCESWCNPYTCDVEDCDTCSTCADLVAGEYCAPWCNDYTCGQSYCTGCTACDYLTLNDGKRCLGWCNTYTCGIDDCAACSQANGEPSCDDTTQFCEGWCNKWTCSSPYCAGCSLCEPCTCQSSWTSAEDGGDCGNEQNGCTNCDADPEGSWCMVESVSCYGAQASGDWFYCSS